MINSLHFIDFQDSTECYSSASLFQSKESFLRITYEFKPGNVYGLISDFGCGSWGFANCIGGRTSKHYTGKILLNGIDICADKLQMLSCFVAEKSFTDLDLPFESLTVKECIAKALAISSKPYSTEQIKAMFSLTDERFERPLSYVSGEIWQISLAIGFSLGKQIFCYPWLNERDIKRFDTACDLGIIKILKENGSIIIVPSSQKKYLQRKCNYVILFENGRLIFR